MKIAKLGLFADVCDAGSLSAAAARNGMSVQNVSKAVSDLERELDSRLFVRTARGVVPTDAALAFLPYARTALKAFDLCESYASALREGEARAEAGADRKAGTRRSTRKTKGDEVLA